MGFAGVTAWERPTLTSPNHRLFELLSHETRPKCYVASPLGFSETTREFYVNRLLPAISEFVIPVDPWSLTDPSEFTAAENDEQRFALGLRVSVRNAKAIRASELLLAQLDGQDVDSGTAAEVGYAAAHGKLCLAIRSDLRQSGEAGMNVNLQVEGFIVMSGGFVAHSLNDLVAGLRDARTAATSHAAITFPARLDAESGGQEGGDSA